MWYPIVPVGTTRAATGTAASIAVDVMASSADEWLMKGSRGLSGISTAGKETKGARCGGRPRRPRLQIRCKRGGEKWSGREDSNLRPLGPEPNVSLRIPTDVSLSDRREDPGGLRATNSLPQAHARLFGGLPQRSIRAGQREFSSLRQLEVGGVIDRQQVSGRQL